MHDNSATLTVERPDPKWMFQRLFWPRRNHEWGSPYDVRAKLPITGPYIRYLGRSDKGEYLDGLVSLFDDLDAAREFTGRKFWRDTFERLANRERTKEPELAATIADVIAKKLPNGNTREELTAVGERIVRLVGQRIASRALPRSELDQRYEAYAAASGLDIVGPLPPAPSVWKQRERMLTLKGMTNQLSWLVARDVLRLGLELECERCGLRSWIHIDQAKQHFQCGGCSHEQSLRGSAEWHYELNSLALRCVTSNQLAALQALCDLAYRARQSFVYSPSMEIFRDNEQKPWHEIDLIALCDGQLIVAEVKDTAIVESDLTELAEIAEALRADEALLYLPASEVMRKHEQWKQTIDARLQKSHIRFDYVPLKQV